MKTEDLINALAADVRTPVRRLKPPVIGLIIWLALSAPWVAFVVMQMGLRPDLALKLAEPGWMLEEAAALMVAVTAAMAALCAGVPGRPHWERWVPVLPLLIWLGTLGAGCLHEMESGPGGLILRSDWACLPGIIMIGLVPGAAMALMLHRRAPLAPVLSVGLGGLAAAALADFGLRLFHQQDARVMVIVWQVGSVALLTAVSALLGPRLVRWRHSRDG
ncbi:hypothetical protein SAMN02745126_04460 [Enhydrobacter aerosaccus]|uniref:DUF1109 domain-containing protein n=1 Tax=Enhydrobacter aerosaccus TaxID=225324 RepID=A0A1T4S9A2_9HYPH|nr:NrsF family protein [Enhydrobacter aerosaccus]SKA24880.1 hypothetical protein SAMN02745126_04460 [Enhydrobacter aerosaccus]